MPQFIAPGVYILERDFSDYVAALQATSVGMVGTATKGPLNKPTLCTSPEQFLQIFGEPTVNQYGPYAAINYLRRGNQLWYVRVAKQYDLDVVALSGAATINTRILAVTGNPFAVGDYLRISEAGKRTTQNVRVSAVTNTQITLDPDGAALMEAYSTAARVDRVAISGNPNPSNAAAQAETMAYSRVLAADTAALPVVKFTAKDPGEWANFGSKRGIEVVIEDGGQMSNINPVTGLPFVHTSGVSLAGILPSAPSVDTKAQLLALDASTGAAAGQTRGVNRDEDHDDLAVVYQCSRLNVNISSIAFANPNVTITVPTGHGITVGDKVTIGGATAGGNNGTFTVTAVTSTTVVVSNASGVAQVGAGGTVLDFHWTPVGVLTKRVRVFYQGRQVEIFDNLIGYDTTSANFWNTAIGDPYGVQNSDYILAEYVGTDGEQPMCTYDAVKYPRNPRLLLGASVAVAQSTAVDADVDTFTQAKGYDGSDPGASTYIGTASATGVVTGLQNFRRVDQYDINLLCVPSITTAAVINEMVDVLEKRGDCLGIVDPPFGLTPQEVVDWHNGSGIYTGDHSAFATNKAALYWPWVKQLDPYTAQEVWLPPSAVIPGVIAFSDSVGETWHAPAGITRGRVPNALALEYQATQGDVEFFYGPGNGNAINAIINFAQDGITVFGQRTLQRTPTALDRVNVRRLLFTIEKAVAKSCRKLVFEQNDPVLWARFRALVNPFLQSLRGRRALEWFQVVCDESTNPTTRRNNNEMGAKIYLIPVKTAEKIVLDFTLLASGTNVSEFIAQDLGVTPNT